MGEIPAKTDEVKVSVQRAEPLPARYVLRPGDDVTVPGLHGSVLSVDRKDEGRQFHYVNRLITPGQTLMQWQSGPYLADSCRQPELPPVPRGCKVDIHVDWQMESPGDYYLQADYLDRRGRLLRSERVPEPENAAAGSGGRQRSGPSDTFGAEEKGDSTSAGDVSLLVPKEADHWRLRLIQSGAGDLWFSSIELSIGEADKG